MSPFDKPTFDFSRRLGAFITVIEQITDLKVVPNEQIAKVQTFPFVTYYPLALDIPVFDDATQNDGLFEATISIDLFAKTLSDSITKATDLRVYLADRYTRQLLRSKAGFVLSEITSIQTRSVTNLPLTDVHHNGFDVTVQYYRNFRSPIDTITSVEGITTQIKEEE